MLCPLQARTPRAPHHQKCLARAGRAPVLLPNPSSSSKTTTPTFSSPAPTVLLSRARRRALGVAAAAQDDAPSSRGDGLITSATGAGGSASPTAVAAAATETSSPPVAPAAAAPAPLTPAAPLAPLPPVAPPDLLIEFEHKLEGDLKAVGVTIVAVTGVIVYWRGVWSLLDHVLGESVFGDVACVVLGLLTVLGVRLSGAKMSSFWPTS